MHKNKLLTLATVLNMTMSSVFSAPETAEDALAKLRRSDDAVGHTYRYTSEHDTVSEHEQLRFTPVQLGTCNPQNKRARNYDSIGFICQPFTVPGLAETLSAEHTSFAASYVPITADRLSEDFVQVRPYDALWRALHDPRRDEDDLTAKVRVRCFDSQGNQMLMWNRTWVDTDGNAYFQRTVSADEGMSQITVHGEAIWEQNRGSSQNARYLTPEQLQEFKSQGHITLGYPTKLKTKEMFNFTLPKSTNPSRHCMPNCYMIGVTAQKMIGRTVYTLIDIVSDEVASSRDRRGIKNIRHFAMAHHFDDLAQDTADAAATEGFTAFHKRISAPGEVTVPEYQDSEEERHRKSAEATEGKVYVQSLLSDIERLERTVQSLRSRDERSVETTMVGDDDDGDAEEAVEGVESWSGVEEDEDDAEHMHAAPARDSVLTMDDKTLETMVNWIAFARQAGLTLNRQFILDADEGAMQEMTKLSDLYQVAGQNKSNGGKSKDKKKRLQNLSRINQNMPAGSKITIIVDGKNQSRPSEVARLVQGAIAQQLVTMGVLLETTTGGAAAE